MQKKGQCPVSFLWRGQGVGLVMMKTSLVSLLVLMGIKVLLLVVHYRVNVSGLFLVSAGCWLVGKLVSSITYGAQKRTRTSTK